MLCVGEDRSASLFCLVQSYIPLPSSGPKPESESLTPWSTAQGAGTDMYTNTYDTEVVAAMTEPPRELTGGKD